MSHHFNAHSSSNQGWRRYVVPVTIAGLLLFCALLLRNKMMDSDISIVEAAELALPAIVFAPVIVALKGLRFRWEESALIIALALPIGYLANFVLSHMICLFIWQSLCWA
jgi:hypothetical protein